LVVVAFDGSGKTIADDVGCDYRPDQTEQERSAEPATAQGDQVRDQGDPRERAQRGGWKGETVADRGDDAEEIGYQR